MKKVLSAVACAAVIGWAGSAMAAPITFTDVEYVNQYVGLWESVSYSHNFTFNPPAQSIISGFLTIQFVDNDRDRNFWTEEYALIFTDSWNIAFEEVDTGAYGYSIKGSSLADGSLGVKIVSTWGDFIVGKSSLDVTYNPVPEPTTMLLFGTGLLGLAAFGRRRKA